MKDKIVNIVTGIVCFGAIPLVAIFADGTGALKSSVLTYITLTLFGSAGYFVYTKYRKTNAIGAGLVMMVILVLGLLIATNV